MAERGKSILKTAFVKANRQDVPPECCVRRRFSATTHHRLYSKDGVISTKRFSIQLSDVWLNRGERFT